MKVGIITIQRSMNYGAALQSYALWKYIDSKGHDCEVIDLFRPTFKDYIESRWFKPYTLKTSLRKRLLLKIKSLLHLKMKQKKTGYNKIFVSRMVEFRNKITLTESFKSVDSLYDNPPQYDLYITGSDQVWNPTMGFCMDPYFLTFAPKGSKKISYASSIGVDSLARNVAADYRKWLKEYDAVSVRENTGKKLLEKLTGRDVKVVLDPTFLLGRDEWLSLAMSPYQGEDYILLFTLSYDENLLTYARKLRDESGKKLIYLCRRQPAAIDYTVVDKAGIEEFIGLIRDAKLMISNSFHGTVFSIMCGSGNFYTYIAQTNKRGSRITDMFETFGLNNHLLNPDLSQTYEALQADMVDRGALKDVLDAEVEKSKQFIDKYL